MCPYVSRVFPPSSTICNHERKLVGAGGGENPKAAKNRTEREKRHSPTFDPVLDRCETHLCHSVFCSNTLGLFLSHRHTMYYRFVVLHSHFLSLSLYVSLSMSLSLSLSFSSFLFSLGIRSPCALFSPLHTQIFMNGKYYVQLSKNTHTFCHIRVSFFARVRF